MKIKWGAIVADGRGKIGGHVASKNRAGAYLRTKVTPVNPSTASQAGARSRLSGLSTAWRSLTAAQRSAWNGAVASFSKTDIFGDVKVSTGFNLYQRLNNNLLVINESVISSPPLPTAVDSFATLSLAAADATVAESMTLTFTDAIAADMKVKVFATSPQSAGKNFVKSEYRLIDVLDDSDSSPANILAAYQAKFGSVGAAGQKIFVKAVQVESSTGIEGVALEASAIVSVSA